MINSYYYQMLRLKELYLGVYGVSANQYEATKGAYDRGYMDAIDLCYQLLTRAIQSANKEEQFLGDDEPNE